MIYILTSLFAVPITLRKKYKYRTSLHIFNVYSFPETMEI
jgi:hypothetical protein